MLESILSNNTGNITLLQILLCTGVSLALGLCCAAVHMYHNVYSKNFVITLAILPVLVQSVIMLVNGNLGTGVAVVGAFSLVRFRSVAGGSREIASIFWSMGIGLATGMGYVIYIAVFSVVIGIVMIVLNSISFGSGNAEEKELKITIPENLDYSGLFDDLFNQYTYSANLARVRTTNMGSLYELVYYVVLKDVKNEKAFIDEIRCRNGNLTIVSGRISSNKNEL